MLNNELHARLQHAVETTDGQGNQIPASSSVPLNGEIVFNHSRTNFKVGDGVIDPNTELPIGTSYGSLPYIIPSAPGTLNTNNSTAQTVSNSEALSGNINLHKVSKTGSYLDLLNKPKIPMVEFVYGNDLGNNYTLNTLICTHLNQSIVNGVNSFYIKVDGQGALVPDSGSYDSSTAHFYLTDTALGNLSYLIEYTFCIDILYGDPTTNPGIDLVVTKDRSYINSNWYYNTDTPVHYKKNFFQEVVDANNNRHAFIKFSVMGYLYGGYSYYFITD